MSFHILNTFVDFIQIQLDQIQLFFDRRPFELSNQTFLNLKLQITNLNTMKIGNR